MPVLYVDGEEIAHSRAIVRYLARKFNLEGGSELNAAKMDAWMETVFESLQKLPFTVKDEGERVRNCGFQTFLSIMYLFPFFIKMNFFYGEVLASGTVATWVEEQNSLPFCKFYPLRLVGHVTNFRSFFSFYNVSKITATRNRKKIRNVPSRRRKKYWYTHCSIVLVFSKSS